MTSGMVNRKVLIVSLRFPPHGGGSVQRTAYLVKYLPSFGWQTHVLTGPADIYGTQDPSLLSILPPGASITRTRCIDGSSLIRLLAKLRLARVAKIFTMPKLDSGWIPYAYHAGKRILSEGEYDLIYSSSYPMSSHIVAYLLKKRTKLAWVADCQDEWSFNPHLKYRTELHKWIAFRLDRLVLNAADRVVTTSPGHTEAFSKRFPSPVADKYVTITNGFEEDDFSLRSSPAHVRKFQGLTIAYVGSLYSYRNVAPFMTAVRELVDEGAIPSEEIVILFVGETGRAEFTGFQKRGIVRKLGHVSHKEAIAHMQAADVLLLIMSRQRSNIPAKLFEYLASGQPILALIPPDSPAAHIVRETKTGIVVDPGDTGQILAYKKLAYAQAGGE